MNKQTKLSPSEGLVLSPHLHVSTTKGISVVRKVKTILTDWYL